LELREQLGNVKHAVQEALEQQADVAHKYQNGLKEKEDMIAALREQIAKSEVDDERTQKMELVVRQKEQQVRLCMHHQAFLGDMIMEDVVRDAFRLTRLSRRERVYLK